MFVRGGYVDPGYDLGDAGYGGYYWSSVSHSSDYAYGLYFGPGGVVPSNYGSRYAGFSVRCVALDGWT